MTNPKASEKHVTNLLIAAPPLYMQIAENLLEQIERGELSPGDRLSSERDLSQNLGVNRLTVRRALQVLEGYGLLERRQGDGTYIAKPKIERQAEKLVPFTPAMLQQGYTPGAKVIVFEKQPAGTSVAKMLNLPISSPVYLIHRVRLLNQEPVMLEKFYISCRLFPDFDQFDHAVRPIYETMKTEYGVTVEWAEQSLEPVVATDYEAELLQIEPGAPLMLERRVAFDREGRPIEGGKDLYRGDRFRFVTKNAPLAVSSFKKEG